MDTSKPAETNEIIKVQFGLRQGKQGKAHDNSEVKKVSKELTTFSVNSLRQAKQSLGLLKKGNGKGDEKRSYLTVFL